MTQTKDQLEEIVSAALQETQGSIDYYCSQCQMGIPGIAQRTNCQACDEVVNIALKWFSPDQEKRDQWTAAFTRWKPLELQYLQSHKELKELQATHARLQQKYCSEKANMDALKTKLHKEQAEINDTFRQEYKQLLQKNQQWPLKKTQSQKPPMKAQSLRNNVLRKSARNQSNDRVNEFQSHTEEKKSVYSEETTYEGYIEYLNVDLGFGWINMQNLPNVRFQIAVCTPKVKQLDCNTHSLRE
eukprot:105059_1